MSSAVQSVLVVDDEPGMRAALKATFQRDGWNVETASSKKEALRALEHIRFPLVVTDVRMPDGDGLTLMRTVRKIYPTTAVVVLTAFGSVPEAVLAIQDGACDYLTKPVCFEKLRSAVSRVMQRADSVAPPQIESCPVVGQVPALTKALDRARHVARTNADVLIEAESGTGKELLARFIHDNSSRRDKSFVAINCAAVPDTLLESELFGHARGAFTGATVAKPGKFELAQGGTLLLDEIGEMPLHLQPKLLRVLQERRLERLGETRSTEVNIRVIATTNVSLIRLVERGEFRADLYYRLNVIPLTLPPLRDRRGDIPALAEFFAEQFAREAGRLAPSLHPDFLSGLQEHNWPGNVRELANFMRRIITLNDATLIGADELKKEALIVSRPPTESLLPQVQLRPGSTFREIERRALENTLRITNGNRTRAAELLGVSVRTMRNKIREYGFPPRRYS